MTIVKGFHIPGFEGDVVARDVGATRILLPQLTADDVARAVDFVEERGREVLAQYTTDDLAAIFGRVAATWQQPSEEKQALVAALADLTGLSRPVVDHSITVEQGNSGAGDILAALDRDLGDHRALDCFVPDKNLNGMTRARGPELVAAILTANVPGLSYLPMVRSLMVKSPLVAKLASGEPIFGPAWLQSVARIEPPLADCVALFCWKGGNTALEDSLFDRAPLVIVYGGAKTVSDLRDRIGPHKKILEHGHKIGLALVGREMLDDRAQARKLAAGLARDVAMFDQRACIAPQIVYVETGGKVGSRDFAAMVSNELTALETELPASAMSLDTAATLAQERNLAQFAAAQSPAMQVLVKDHSTVVHEAGACFQGVLPTRYLRVCPVDDLAEVFPLLDEHGPYLQNIGLAVGRKRRLPLAEKLAGAGVSHITGLGRMHKPTMRWKHDGLSPFSEMVRWTDIEMMDTEEEATDTAPLPTIDTHLC